MPTPIADIRKIPFTKMHGAANDYIYISFMENNAAVELSEIPELSVAMSRRHFSVGADGIVCICPPSPEFGECDAVMRMFNADGSEGMMCGNAIRCVGKYLYDHGFISSDTVKIGTLSGVRRLTLTLSGGKCTGASVKMGRAVTAPREIPLSYSDGDEPLIGKNVYFGGYLCMTTVVSMGNPHGVVFLDRTDSLPDDPEKLDLPRLGPAFENDKMFPERVNTEFVRMLPDGSIEMRVWERGSGETLACGTGACAAVAAAVLNGRAPYNAPVTVRLRGGELCITVTDSLDVTMTGPAETVYDGVYYYEKL